ncbi:MAG: hypothetical protein CMD35_02625 [Flavobacteriales bacterium]|nr:hypothetical protein [Flavobacteriales bacterium]
MRFSLFFFIIFLTFSCNEFTNQNSSETLNKTTDTLNYDSIIIPEDEIKSIKDYFSNFIKKRKFNGHILIAKKGKIIFDTTSGYANIKKKIKLDENSAMQVASITKPITATVILQLLEEGKLSLTDTITKYLTKLPENYHKITIKQLLSHRSGLSPYPYYCHDKIENKKKLIYNDTVLCVIDFHNPKPYYSPNQKYNYCNTNYMLLASIIEKIENKTYAEVIDKRIIEKCSMKNSFVFDMTKKETPTNLVLGHTKANKVFNLDYLDGVVGDKGFFSNARDLLLFDRMLSKGGLINDSILELAFTPQNKIQNKKSYGLGWRIKMDKKFGKIIYHTGWWHGNRNIYIKIPKTEYTIILLSNALRGSSYNMNNLLKQFVFSENKTETTGNSVSSITSDYRKLN